MRDGKNSSLVRKLFNAVIRNDVKEVVDLVRNQGVDVDSRDARHFYLHQTALHKAAMKGYLDMVRVLVEDLGADINIDDILGYSPIQRAIQYGKGISYDNISHMVSHIVYLKFIAYKKQYKQTLLNIWSKNNVMTRMSITTGRIRRL